MAKLDAIADLHAQAVTRAYEHGVTIAMGTDIALTGPDLPNAWGQNGSEPGYLVKLGMSPLQAIEAATAIRAAHARPAGAAQRAARRGLRRRRDHPGRRSAGGHRRARRPAQDHRGLDAGAAGEGRCWRLDAQGEVDLVVQRDAVVAGPRDLRLLLPGTVDRARPQFGQPEPAALVEPERVDVVVRWW